MKGFYFQHEGKVNEWFFNRKVEVAKQYLTAGNGLGADAFELISDVRGITVTVGDRNYKVRNILYRVVRDGQPIGLLDCMYGNGDCFIRIVGR